ncbi:MAG: hypothetical protein LH702_35350 [Phormidesmis sp. CAN_BIN44]|nr:hypothetical protein [Phormidesmis sp. CAN_BIN44]
MTYSFHRLEGFQLPLFRGVDPYYLQNPQIEDLRVPSLDEQFLKRVLGGSETLKAREGGATDGYVKNHAHGWIEFHQVKRQRKNGEVWECKQAWLHWEEKGRKRSRYIPKAKYADVEQSVYVLKASVEVTLKLLEKRK